MKTLGRLLGAWLLAMLFASPGAFAQTGPRTLILYDAPPNTAYTKLGMSYAIMLRKDDAPFKAVVDGTLTRLFKSGEFEALYKKWFQSPIPPKGINLNAPMSKELQNNLKELSDQPAL